jgi:hypothetical protein
MIQVRRGTFETNSSSTHSIAIPNNDVDVHGIHTTFGIGEYGWEWDRYHGRECANYFYTALVNKYPVSYEEKMSDIKDYLSSHGITCDWETPKISRWTGDENDEPTDDNTFLDEGYIDHSEDLDEFLDAVLSDKDLLIKLIVNGEIRTGNDNGYDDDDSIGELLNRDNCTTFYKGN